MTPAHRTHLESARIGRDEPDAVFWDRLLDMPWSEAEEECVRRREQVVARVAESNSARSQETNQKRRDLLGRLLQNGEAR